MSASDEAKKLVLGDRNQTYGTPKDDYTCTAALWSAYLSGILSNPITPEQAIMMMALVKVSRLARNPTHHDSLVDAHGYLTCYEWVVTGKKPE